MVCTQLTASGAGICWLGAGRIWDWGLEGGAGARWGHLKKPCWKAERRRVLRMRTSAIWHISMLMKNTV